MQGILVLSKLMWRYGNEAQRRGAGRGEITDCPFSDQTM